MKNPPGAGFMHEFHYSKGPGGLHCVYVTGQKPVVEKPESEKKEKKSKK